MGRDRDAWRQPWRTQPGSLERIEPQKHPMSASPALVCCFPFFGGFSFFLSFFGGSTPQERNKRTVFVLPLLYRVSVSRLCQGEQEFALLRVHPVTGRTHQTLGPSCAGVSSAPGLISFEALLWGFGAICVPRLMDLRHLFAVYRPFGQSHGCELIF